MLRQNRTLKSLDISSNCITDIDPVTGTLTTTNNVLTGTLTIINNVFKILKVRHSLIKRIEKSAWMDDLTEVDLARNELDKNSGKAIAYMLVKSKTLKILQVWGNPGIRSSIPKMMQALRDNTTLIELGRPVHHESVMPVGEMLAQNKMLQYLNLKPDLKGDSIDWRPIVDDLRRNQDSKLKRLIMDADGVRHLKTQLEAVKSDLLVVCDNFKNEYL
ncbi:unnamed protein product [Prorocentrum cordatum]|uniref:Uncharacterized protein n=1 Tax=Prorocentrum cordatum TaxID=2364126 RepID=A0ABN9X2X6_9DINO|nr:unnamed protein product [Polarella glacialis]